MLKTIIVSGGNISEEFLNKKMLNNKYDNIIACDRGLEILDNCKVLPNCIIGDFDSINKKILDKYANNNAVKIIELNPKKDYTDTHMALKYAIETNSTDITIIGAIGSRMDHTISNINILKEALENDINCKILNENNKIALINKNTKLSKDNNYKYISLLPLTNIVTEVTLKGLKYSLVNATLKLGESIGVSNEQLDDESIIELKEGILIVIQSKD